MKASVKYINEINKWIKIRISSRVTAIIYRNSSVNLNAINLPFLFFVKHSE